MRVSALIVVKNKWKYAERETEKKKEKYATRGSKNKENVGTNFMANKDNKITWLFGVEFNIQNISTKYSVASESYSIIE